MRRRWSRTGLAVLRDILHYSTTFLVRGVFARMARISWPVFVTSLLAPSLVLLALLLSLLSAIAAAGFAPWPVAVAAGMLVFAGCVRLRAVIEPKIAAFWLARICAFISDQGCGKAPDMEARSDAFAALIADELEKGAADEVLVVGHSVGTHIGVAVCARVLERLGEADRRFSFLTLGHTIPLLGLQPAAHEFRRELARVAADPRIAWVDISAVMDGACFPLTDPVWGSGLTQPDPARPKPKVLSARFPKLFTPATYRQIQRNFSRTHFQYLMAAELAGDYDYFLITAGDMTLEQRFAHLQSVTGFNQFRLGGQ